MRKMTKATRIRRMLERGATTEQIVKATGSSKQYVYTISTKMKKEKQEKKWKEIDMMLSATGITPLASPVDLTKLDEVSAQHKKDIEAHIAEIDKHNKPTLWQRVKSLFGF